MSCILSSLNILIQASRLSAVMRGARCMSTGKKLKAPPMVYIKVRRLANMLGTVSVPNSCRRITERRVCYLIHSTWICKQSA